MIRRTQNVVGRRRFDVSRRVRLGLPIRRWSFLPQVQQRITWNIGQMFRLPVVIKCVKTFELFRRQTFVLLPGRSERSGPMKIKCRTMVGFPSESFRVQMTIILFDIRHFHRGLTRLRLISKDQKERLSIVFNLTLPDEKSRFFPQFRANARSDRPVVIALVLGQVFLHVLGPAHGPCVLRPRRRTNRSGSTSCSLVVRS